LAESISTTLDFDLNVIAPKIKIASKLRGKHVHNITEEWGNLIESEKLLREILLKYMKKEMNI
jgi:hypothetical protein